MMVRAILEAGTALGLLARRTDMFVAEPARLEKPSASSRVGSAERRAGPAERLVDAARDLLAWRMDALLDREVRRVEPVDSAAIRADGKAAFEATLSAEAREAYDAIRDQGLFDRDWYLEAYPDVAHAGIEPLHHFIRHGIREGRAPNGAIAFGMPIGAAVDPRVGLCARYRAIASALSAADAWENPVALRFIPQKGQLYQFTELSVRRGLSRFERFPLFKARDYLALNSPLRDVPGLVAHEHAFTYGFVEGRTVFCRHTTANELGLRSRAPVDQATKADLDADVTTELKVSILCNASGNSFLQEIAECLLFDLRGDGHDAVLLDDSDDPARVREHNIIVAPHEFFSVGRGPSWIRDDIVRRSVMFNTEQPQTVWFERAVPFNMMAKGVIDISPQVASIYAECMPAIHCDLGGPPVEDELPYVEDPVFRVLPTAARKKGHRESRCQDRCIDVSFFGGMSEHRDRFFAQTARFFADYKTFFYCRRDGSPLRKGAVDMLSSARHVAFHSKIVLNLHREEFGFFEWHRIVRLGIEAGALVVSEPCLPHPTFKPNVHYFEESGRHIQNLIEWLLRTPDGQAEYHAVRQHAFLLVDDLRARRTPGRGVSRFLAGLEGCTS